MDRRNFLARVVQFFSAGIAALMATPVVRFASSSLNEKNAEPWHDIAVISDLPPDEVTQIQYSTLVRDGWMSSMVQETAYVNRTKEGNCVVFDPHCTHLGCVVAWNANAHQFQCPCHGGKYDAGGNRVAGPPPRPLRKYETRIANGVLSIGKLKGA